MPVFATLLLSVVTTLAAFFALPACSATELPAPGPDSALPLQLSGARIRLMPPGATSTALYFDIHNTGTRPVTVTRAEVVSVTDHTQTTRGTGTRSGKETRSSEATQPLAEKVMLHRTVTQGNVKKMVHNAGVVIEPGQTVHFEPGGHHVMLIGLHRTLQAGQQYELRLYSGDNDRPVTTTAMVTDMQKSGRKTQAAPAAA